MSSYMILTIGIVGWGALGAMLGPLAIVAAVATSRHEKDEQPSMIVPATPLGGPVDVLVGIDGSVECRLALERVIALFGPRLGRLCLSNAVLGSTASALATACPVPALIVSALPRADPAAGGGGPSRGGRRRRGGGHRRASLRGLIRDLP